MFRIYSRQNPNKFGFALAAPKLGHIKDNSDNKDKIIVADHHALFLYLFLHKLHPQICILPEYRLYLGEIQTVFRQNTNPKNNEWPMFAAYN